MKILASAIASLFFVSIACAETHTWSLGDKGGFQLSHPAEAQFEQVSPPEERKVQAFTIRFPDRNGISTISYQVLIAPAENSSDWTDFEKIDAFLNESGQRGLQSSVEKKVMPIHLKMKHGFASYAVFTRPRSGGQGNRPAKKLQAHDHGGRQGGGLHSVRAWVYEFNRQRLL